MKNRRHNENKTKNKRRNNDPHNTAKKTKDSATRTLLTTGVKDNQLLLY
jgi:hypothetical protein